MATRTEEDASPLQPWNNWVVAAFDGAFQSNIKTGEDYSTITLAELFAMEPSNRAKGSGPAFVPSSYVDFDAREHAAQRERGAFVALTGDVDCGDHAMHVIRNAVRSFVGESAALIYSSAHARPGDMRWRIILPLAMPHPFETWHDAQCAFFAFMEARGIEMDHALARAAQPVYSPNVPPVHAKSGTALRSAGGEPLYYRRDASPLDSHGLDIAAGHVGEGIAAIRRKRADDESERGRIRKEAEARRANKPRGDGASIIDDFNATNSVATMLELCGYEQSPRSAEDWRSPHQTGETYATRVIGSKWVSLSTSDAAARIGETCKSGCFGDAYDLFAHYKHGGDHKAAYRALHAEQRANNVIHPPQFNPPEWMADIPSYDDMPDWVGEAGGENHAEVADAIAANDDTPSLPYFWFDEARPDLDANDFVEGLLTTGTMSVIYGQSNCGKTFFVLDLALHVAWGREWRGKEVDRGAVVYLSLEGSQGIRNRMSAFRKHHDINERLPFVAMPQPINLLDNEADVAAVIALVQHVAHETNLPIAMVIIDTLSRAMAGGNENSPEDMTALIGNCDRIRHATGSHVCVVHHSGKDDAKGARGHSSLRAATDTEIEIKRDPEMTYSSVRIAKQRDLEAGDPFGFTLQGIPLGTNRRGKDVTSCVVVEADKTVVVGRMVEKLSTKEKQALEALDRCLLAGGFEFVTDDVTAGVTACSINAWKMALQSGGVTDRNNPETGRVQYYRIKNALERKGKIGTSGDVVWIA